MLEFFIALWLQLRGRENLEKTDSPLHISLKCLLKIVRATSQAMLAQATPKSLHLCCHPTAYLRPDHSSQYWGQVGDILPSHNTVTKTPIQPDSTHPAKAVLAYFYHLWLSSCPTLSGPQRKSPRFLSLENKGTSPVSLALTVYP